MLLSRESSINTGQKNKNNYKFPVNTVKKVFGESKKL